VSRPRESASVAGTKDPWRRAPALLSRWAASVPRHIRRMLGEEEEDGRRRPRPGVGPLGEMTVAVGGRETKDKGAAVAMSSGEASGALRTLETHGLVILGCGSAGSTLLSRGTLKRLNASADRIEGTVCALLEGRGIRFRGGPGSAKYSPFSYAEAASRCLGRVDVRIRAPGFDEEALGLERCGSWLPLVHRALGDDAVLAYAGLVLSFPGSVAQPWHADGPHLFGADGLQCPPHALNVFVPLEDVEPRLGPTEFLPGTHRLEATRTLDLDADGGATDGAIAPLLRAGTALVYDYRTVHKGVPNTDGARTRKMLYLLYARPWFRDHINFGKESLLAGGSAGGEGSRPVKRPRGREEGQGERQGEEMARGRVQAWHGQPWRGQPRRGHGQGPGGGRSRGLGLERGGGRAEGRRDGRTNGWKRGKMRGK